MKKFVFLLLLYLSAGWIGAKAQVAISEDGSAPDSSAMLDVKSANKGFLLPRVALISADSPEPVTNPATGLIVFNTATSGQATNHVYPGLYWWNGLRWIKASNEKKYDYPPLPDDCSAYGTVTDVDGNVYPTVLIGTQEWMAQNLKASHENSGEPLQFINYGPMCTIFWRESVWGTFAYRYYDYQYDSLGCLYKHASPCPPGFHIPSIDDWNILINFLGGDSVAGGKLKATSFNGTNETCFSAIEAGYIDELGNSDYTGAYFICYPPDIKCIILNAYSNAIIISGDDDDFDNRDRGFSIRCVKHSY
jgi:uncharacterized protein (TIGR02145 family)